MKRVLSRALRVLPALALLLMIFFFSQQQGAQSNNLSMKVSRFLLTNFSFVLKPGFSEMTPAQQEYCIAEYNGEVRQMGHGGIFLLLAVAMYLAVKRSEGQSIAGRMLLAYFLTALFAVSDEIHQLFTDGRAFQLIDIIVDMGGGGAGVMVSGLFSHLRALKKNK